MHGNIDVVYFVATGPHPVSSLDSLRLEKRKPVVGVLIRLESVESGV